MTGVLRTVGKIAGTVASVAAFVPGGQGIAAIAGAVAAITTFGAQLTASPPAAKGQVNERVLGSNNPLPYAIGRTYSGGIQVYDDGYGPEIKDVKNPYRFIVAVHSCCGPIQSMTSMIDYAATSYGAGSPGNATGYYHDYLWRDYQLGARPEANELKPAQSGAPGWGASSKLSSFAAAAHTFKWSKKAKRFPGGQMPVVGELLEGVSVYDPRLDSTYPGGSGSQRIDNEATWTYSRNPALHALAYAYGRYVEGVRVFGADMGAQAINLAHAVAWANVCDANGWTVNGVIYEPGDKWNNLKRICEAGGGEPVLAGGLLGFEFQAPRVPLYTVTKHDLAGPVSSHLSKGWRNRINTMVPKYRSEAHQWQYVQGAEVSNAAWVAEDGETKRKERQFDLVTDKDQAAELITYDLHQRREAGPITLPCKPHMRDYGPGDCLTLAADLGVHPDGAIKAVVRRRAVDPITGVVTLDLEQETDAKHTAAVGSIGTAPPARILPSSEEIEQILALNALPVGYLNGLISSSFVTGADPATGLLQADAISITVADHSRSYSDVGEVAITGALLGFEDDGTTALAEDTYYHIYYDDLTRDGGAVTLKATRTSTVAVSTDDNLGRHYVGTIKTDVVGGTGTSGNGPSPDGWGGSDYFERTEPL